MPQKKKRINFQSCLLKLSKLLIKLYFDSFISVLFNSFSFFFIYPSTKIRKSIFITRNILIRLSNLGDIYITNHLWRHNTVLVASFFSVFIYLKICKLFKISFKCNCCLIVHEKSNCDMNKERTCIICIVISQQVSL